MDPKVIIIGAGIAGLTAAGALAEKGHHVLILEKEAQPGGHVAQWDRLFPSRRPGSEVLDQIRKTLNDRVEIKPGTRISGIIAHENDFTVLTDEGASYNGQALLIASGFRLFQAERKEEYGYGIYDNVITSAEVEAVFKQGKKLLTNKGTPPQRVALIHCVGSRDEKVGNLYCSKVCCVTGVKQAIEIKEQLPQCEVFSFYMDMRMYDRHFEELYFEAQKQWGVQFIRGRLSECSETPDQSLIIKTEDTLTGRPLRMTVDLVILLVGFVPEPETGKLVEMLGLSTGTDGFILPSDEHYNDNMTTVPGVFLTGAVKGPATIPNTIADARAAALQIDSWLKTNP